MSTCGRRIPDWRDANAYPKCFDDIYEGDWRWEFLKRSPDYREAWNRGTPDTDIQYHSEIENIDRKPAPEDSDISSTVFRLTHLVDPWGDRRIPNAPAQVFDASTGALTINPAIHGIPRGPGIVMIGFDINRPLKPQLADAERHLKFQQKSLKEKILVFKKQKDKWPRHIRVIDAFDQGATPTEVYNQFAKEKVGGNEEMLDDFYRPGSQPDATAMGWHLSALKVMEMAIRLL